MFFAHVYINVLNNFISRFSGGSGRGRSGGSGRGNSSTGSGRGSSSTGSGRSSASLSQQQTPDSSHDAQVNLNKTK